MTRNCSPFGRHLLGLFLIASVASTALLAQAPADDRRPMTFLDVQLLKRAGSPTPSPDGAWLLHTISTPDWQEAKRQSDLYLVSLADGVSSARQMTFTDEKNETSPAWSRDGGVFFFLSNRDAPENASGRNQIYSMRPDGGEARRITDAPDGVTDFALSKDGGWLAYRSGRAGARQLFRLPVEGIGEAEAEQLTERPRLPRRASGRSSSTRASRRA
jgi:Tol biopolymer transport system component